MNFKTKGKANGGGRGERTEKKERGKEKKGKEHIEAEEVNEELEPKPDQSEKERKEAAKRAGGKQQKKKKKKRKLASSMAGDMMGLPLDATTPRARLRETYTMEEPREVVEEKSLEEEETEFFAGMGVNLAVLNLSGNMLTGVSNKISELKALRKLDLSKNNLTELAEGVWLLANLEWLDLSQNKLTRLSLPKGIMFPCFVDR